MLRRKLLARTVSLDDLQQHIILVRGSIFKLRAGTIVINTSYQSVMTNTETEE